MKRRRRGEPTPLASIRPDLPEAPALADLIAARAGWLGRTKNGGVDADETTRAVEQGSARVSRIDGGVCLNHPLYGSTGHGLNLSPQRAYYSRSQSLVQPEGITDGKDLLPHFQII